MTKKHEIRNASTSNNDLEARRKFGSTNGGDELLARIGNYEICKAAFEKALFLYPNEHLEMRQGARVILKSA